jgi:hypothetical protein
VTLRDPVGPACPTGFQPGCVCRRRDRRHLSPPAGLAGVHLCPKRSARRSSEGSSPVRTAVRSRRAHIEDAWSKPVGRDKPGGFEGQVVPDFCRQREGQAKQPAADHTDCPTGRKVRYRSFPASCSVSGDPLGRPGPQRIVLRGVWPGRGLLPHPGLLPRPQRRRRAAPPNVPEPADSRHCAEAMRSPAGRPDQFRRGRCAPRPVRGSVRNAGACSNQATQGNAVRSAYLTHDRVPAGGEIAGREWQARESGSG